MCKGKTDEIMEMAGIKANDPKQDPRPFGFIGNTIWKVIQKTYYTKLEPGKLETIKLKEDENVIKFVQEFQEKWRDETGRKWDESPASASLFRMMLKKALPEEVLEGN